MTFDFSSVPKGFIVRRIEEKDFQGAKDALKFLTEVEPLSADKFKEILHYWNTHFLMDGKTPIFHCLVIVKMDDNDPTKEIGVAAIGTLIIEQKMIHGGALTGHIEDIAVNSKYQGLKLGKGLIKCLSSVGEKTGCYKVILDCEEKNIGFYEKCGYKNVGAEMQIRYI